MRRIVFTLLGLLLIAGVGPFAAVGRVVDVKNEPVEDVSVEDPPLEEVIAQMFSMVENGNETAE